MNRCQWIGLGLGTVTTLVCAAANLPAAEAAVDLTRAVVVVRPDPRAPAERTAATVLVEEIEKRTGVRLGMQNAWPTDAPAVIAITTRDGKAPWLARVPRREGADLPEVKPEGFAIRTTAARQGQPATVFVVGADGRGTLFGIGRLLRTLRCTKGTIALDIPCNVTTAPEYPIRGHQLGYRARANSYDAWTPAQYEQYIRELVLFGANCIENIPFEDTRKNPLMKVSREEMNRALSEICARYEIDYWVWTPADFPLKDAARRKAALEQHEALYQACPRLDAVFFPGGDPGDNPPELVLPFLEDLSPRLAKHHPAARIWLSLQGFDRDKCLSVLAYLREKSPPWFAGIVAGPSSPPIPMTRVRLPKRYKLRWYPDITHTIRCQYPVDWWDPAFAFTLGREPVNPRPADSAAVFRLYAPHTDGFLTYSDGIHDDANKAVWSLLGWNSSQDVREMLTEYARFFFGPQVAAEAADALLGLENNWRGPLALNAGVDGVLTLWQRLAEKHPPLLQNWRFQMYLMRAYYDAYTRHRLIYETTLQQEAMHLLAQAGERGADRAMQEALVMLRRAETERCRPAWRKQIHELADTLFQSIGYQTSVKQHHASGAERGAVLDFLDHPLNDRWWLEDEFARIGKTKNQSEKLARLGLIAAWENPAPGSYYDDVGHVGKSPRVIRGERTNTDPETFRHENPSHSWWDNGRSRRRLAWQHHMRWPAGMLYEGLDPEATYTLRLTGQGQSPLRADGLKLTPTRDASQIGQFREFPVPPEATADGQLRLTWDAIDESHLNWRQYSHAAEVWLLKR